MNSDYSKLNTVLYNDLKKNKKGSSDIIGPPFFVFLNFCTNAYKSVPSERKLNRVRKFCFSAETFLPCTEYDRK